MNPPFVVVASPAYTEGAAQLEELGDLETRNWFFSAASSEQQVWGQALGLDFDTIPFRDLQSNALVHAAVREGYGLSIQALSLVERDLKEGRMVALEQGDSAGLGYFMVTPANAPVPPKVRRVMAWLRRQAKGH